MRLIDPYRLGVQVDAILGWGDSITAGRVEHTASVLPAPGTAFEYDLNTGTILPFGSGAPITNKSQNAKSPWAKFCIDYYALTGRAACIINCGSSSSTVAPDAGGNDWQTTGNNLNAAITAANNCLALLNKTELTAIVSIVLINDVQVTTYTVAQVETYFGTTLSTLTSAFGSNVPMLFAQIGQTDTIRISARLTAIRNVLTKACFNNTNCSIAANLGAFMVGGFYESDNIHPNVTGNDHLGAMFARWFKNSAYSKWPRTIISCHFDELTTSYKSTIESWFSTYLSVYQNGIDCMYATKSKSSIDTAWDWRFFCAPDLNGGFTFVADSHIATAGNTSSLFQLGYNPTLTTVNCLNNDYLVTIKIKAVNTPSGTLAAAFGGFVSGSPNHVNFLRQLNTLGVNWSVLSQTSYTYSGENTLSAGKWMMHRDVAGTITLRKNGTVIQGPTTDTLTTPPSTKNALGCFYNSATASSPIDAQFERIVIVKSSLVTDKAQFELDLDALQNY